MAVASFLRLAILSERRILNPKRRCKYIAVSELRTVMSNLWPSTDHLYGIRA